MLASPRHLVCVALASAVATACSAPVGRSTHAPRAVPRTATQIAIPEVAPSAVAIDEPAAPSHDPLILIERAHDPKGVSGQRRTLLGQTIEDSIARTFARAGFGAARDSGARTTARYVVSPTLTSLTVISERHRATISCSVTLRIATWSAERRLERWDPDTTALARGEARATTSNTRTQIELGVRDCVEAATRAAATHRAIPFLVRVSRRG